MDKISKEMMELFEAAPEDVKNLLILLIKEILHTSEHPSVSQHQDS